jgi:hypothetical protein
MIESSLPVPGKRRSYKADGRMRTHHHVREGQIVRVIDGPLTGFRGEVKEVDEQTAKVAVQVFGRVTPMDLALGGRSNWCEKIQTEALQRFRCRRALSTRLRSPSRSHCCRDQPEADIRQPILRSPSEPTFSASD